MNSKTAVEILSLPMRANDADAESIGEYLVALLVALWMEGEAFSGKRPFGNSGWQYDVYLPLVKAGVVKGEIDEDGWLSDCDEETADKIVLDAIHALNNIRDSV